MVMPTQEALEERLAALEREVKDLRQRLERGQRAQDWHGRVYGSLSDVPEFEQVLWFGKKTGQSDEDTPTSDVP